MTQPLKRITHSAIETPTHTIIWMHGLGASADDFLSIIPHLNLNIGTQIIFPQAPVRPITVNNGMWMPGWYDIKSFSFSEVDNVGIAQSVAQIGEIYQDQISQGIAAQNIYFAGFSQGGVMALTLGTQYLCGGILALSCYLTDPESLPKATEHSPSIMQMHGRHDPIVAYALGEYAHQRLLEQGYDAQWKSYDMGHEICFPQIIDIAKWLKSQNL
ncbi:alpha/beta hydrolase [Suttonella ornithocola]|uniref:Carboxylesterase 2 n=1 Tax=Suttonella ornithocola TaxID=279832 RepID=A0A380MZ79_9GAMM|nr:hypothetical protein [Suttonella ornithocola]SUO97865.1 Carboxylesterase 2 [Suttonella ornithocola]